MEYKRHLDCNSCNKTGSYFDTDEKPSFTFGGKFCVPIGICKQCLKQGEEEHASIERIAWK